MPIVEIRSLPQPPGFERRAALGRVATELAAELNVPGSQVWVTWRELAPGEYVEGTAGPAFQPPGTHPPLARVLALEGRSPETIRRMVETIARSIGSAFAVESDNVFVWYEELRAGRVFSAGAILE